MEICRICGEENCKRHSFFVGKAITLKEFSGSSPPEIFVGKWSYPNVYAGILSPPEIGDTSILSSPEQWHEKKLTIPEIISFRNRLIYGRAKTNIKKVEGSFMPVMREVAMTHKSISAEFKLKKPVIEHKETEASVPLIKNAAEVENVRLQENAPVRPKIDYLVNDTEVKSSSAIMELDKAGIENSSIVKILSAGLLGLRKNRKLVPTRWSITAVDDLISKTKINKVKQYKEIQDFQVFHAEFLGNHYEFLLLPDKWSFEVLEISTSNMGVWHDFEGFEGRKVYAESVTGAYYANRLALAEYLERIQRQCQCIVFRQISEEYTSPLGVGILRQTSREAFSKTPEKFNTVQEALERIQSRLKLPIRFYTDKSVILKNFGKQKRLSQFF